MRALALLVALLAAGAAQAHAPEAMAAPSLWQWQLEPWLLALLAGSAALYAQGVRRLWRQAGPGRGIGRTAVLAFAAGWLVLVLALVSPLDPLGARLFSAHMVQHELLMVVAAPLLVLGRPLAAWTWAFEPPMRQALGRAVQLGPVQFVWSLLTDPVVAWGLHAVALWSWHLPSFFSAALGSEWIHILQHTSFLGTALFFWWAVLGRDARVAQGTGQAVALLFTTMLHTAALGALLSLAPTVWYAPYVATSTALGIDPVEDQQLGGLVMWVPSGLAYVVAALVLLGRLLTRRQRVASP
ncbi:MAG: cytochrome c oxidase assembly protein [Ramlibacter sp.]